MLVNIYVIFSVVVIIVTVFDVINMYSAFLDMLVTELRIITFLNRTESWGSFFYIVLQKNWADQASNYIQAFVHWSENKNL